MYGPRAFLSWNASRNTSKLESEMAILLGLANGQRDKSRKHHHLTAPGRGVAGRGHVRAEDPLEDACLQPSRISFGVVQPAGLVRAARAARRAAGVAGGSERFGAREAFCTTAVHPVLVFLPTTGGASPSFELPSRGAPLLCCLRFAAPPGPGREASPTRTPGPCASAPSGRRGAHSS